MDAEFQASSNQRRCVGLDLRKRVHDRHVLLNALENGAEAAGHATLLTSRIDAVQFGGKCEDVDGTRHRANREQQGPSLSGEA